jgi:hypothetical protein
LLWAGLHHSNPALRSELISFIIQFSAHQATRSLSAHWQLVTLRRMSSARLKRQSPRGKATLSVLLQFLRVLMRSMPVSNAVELRPKSERYDCPL